MMAKPEEPSTPKAAPQPLIALAFDTNGELLCSAEVERNAVYFDADPKMLRRSRVFILPKAEEERGLAAMNLQQLEQRAAFEPRLRFNENNGLVFERIPDFLQDIWWWRRCCIRGRITNQATVAGQLEAYPVCNATVHICEVDTVRYWIERIDPDILERLRWDLVEQIPFPVPQPGPINPPFPRPVPARPSFVEFADAPVQRPSIQLPDLQLLGALKTQMVYAPQPTAVRQLLLEHFEILQPLICRFSYIWPWLYRCDELAVVQTDNNGRFEACIWHQGDQPDVYIWVEYPIGSALETVYRPGIACGTRWNYECGEDINLQLRDSRIPPVCGIPLEGNSVAIRAIGHGVSPLQIQQQLSAQATLPGRNNFKTVGLTNYQTDGLGSYHSNLADEYIRPFTGNLPVFAQFGDALPAAGVRYFQVQYRRTHNAAMQVLINPASLHFGWKTMNSGPLSRQYSIQVGLDFEYEYYDLGPFQVNGQQVYRIPPLDPQLPGVDGAPASSDPSARWSRYDRVQIGRIPTQQLDGEGLYEFRIRFLDENGHLADVGPEFFRVPDPEDANSTMQAPNGYIRNIGDDAVFQFRLRIDNTAPDLSILEVKLEEEAVMTDCGFVEYDNLSDDVELFFEATHPQGFALFNFNLERGRRESTANHFALGDAHGIVTGGKVPYSLSGGVYQAQFAVADLLAGCGAKAAFSEVLTVYGLHTDGTHAGNLFRRSVSNAFALAPK